MRVEIRIYTRGSPSELLTEQQRSESLGAFVPSVEVTEISEDLQRSFALGSNITTIIVATIAFAAGQLSAGFFGEIGKDAWAAIKRGIAQILRQRNDAQYSTAGIVYIVLSRADGKAIVVSAYGVVPGKSGELSDDEIEGRLASQLDAYRERQSEVDRLLESAAKDRGQVLHVKIIDERLRVVNSYPSLNAFRLKVIPSIHNFIDQGPPPTITSPNKATAVIGSLFSFQVTATGLPAITESGRLPDGVSFSPYTQAFSGTPQPGSRGSYPVTIIADNHAGAVTQRFILTVS